MVRKEGKARDSLSKGTREGHGEIRQVSRPQSWKGSASSAGVQRWLLFEKPTQAANKAGLLKKQVSARRGQWGAHHYQEVFKARQGHPV